MMKKGWKHIILILVILAGVLREQVAFAQTIDAFARVSISPREGVVRQPYRVTISVYSSTWFAKPLQFTNLRIDDAFIIPFTRTVSGINYINNRKYATLTFYYLVFPYNTGQMQIPELVINANIPPEGDYRGQDYTIRTKAQTIRISDVPSSKEEPVWMVAKNIRIQENWNRSFTNLKVGDVIEREIVVSAEGTLPSLIQPFEIEKPEGTSIYPQQADLEDKRNNQDVNGERVERYSYLFEEEGEVIIPEEEILWWNPETKRVYKRTLPEQILTVAPNPDLAMMESLKDSLLALNTPVELDAGEKTFPWLRVAFFAVLALAFYLLWKLAQIVIGNLKVKQANYRESEAFYFKMTKQALKKGTSAEFIRALYVWFDKARVPEQDASLYSFLKGEEKAILEYLMANKDERITAANYHRTSTLIYSLRKRINDSESYFIKMDPLNPI